MAARPFSSNERKNAAVYHPRHDDISLGNFISIRAALASGDDTAAIAATAAFMISIHAALASGDHRVIIHRFDP